MTSKMGWAGVCLLSSLTWAGCSDVEKCTVGEPGCVEGETLDDGSCKAGLIAQDGMCVEPGGGVGGGDGGSGEPDYCEDADSVPQTVSVPPPCEPPESLSNPNPEPFEFGEICRRKCLQECRRAEVMCEGYECDPSICERAVIMVPCQTECMGDTECMTESCKEVQNARCSEFQCPSGHAPRCNAVHCSDTCSGNNDDGFCDDGDPQSALYSLCAYGTDCSDCGPRVGARPARSPLGGLCPAGRDVACEGYNDDFLRNEAFCVHVEGTQAGQFTCVPDCTSDDETCPDGFECELLFYSGGEPYVDLDEVQGAACFPTFCS